MATRKNTQAVMAPLIKTLIFALVGTLIFAMLWVELGDIRFKDSNKFKAIFANSSQLKPKESVTASGVKVGTVKDVKVHDNDKAIVEFTVDADRPLTEGTQVFIRYANLTGDHYLELRPGPGGMKQLEDGATIPLSNTQPALDLDVLLAGFNPLFEGLGRQDPTQINELAANIIGVFQGQSGAIGELLTKTASLAGTLSDRDRVIGEMIDNLNTTLSTLDRRSEQLSETFLKLQQFVTGLAENRDPLTGNLVSFANTAQEFGDVANVFTNGLDTGLPAVKAFVDGILKDRSQESYLPAHPEAVGTELERILSIIPGMYLRMGRASTSLAGYALTLCQVVVRLTGPDGEPYFTPPVGPNKNDPRCTLDTDHPLKVPPESQGAPERPYGAPNYDQEYR